MDVYRIEIAERAAFGVRANFILVTLFLPFVTLAYFT